VSTGPDGLREAVDRNARAVMTGNFAQIMADITPEALAQMMQQMPASGQFSLMSMPTITGYDVEAMAADGDACVYNVTFRSEAGTVTLASQWKQVLGQWKITGVQLVSLDPNTAPPTA